MMHSHSLLFVTATLALACTGEKVTTAFQPVGASARVRVVNASALDISVLLTGSVVAGSLLYAQSTACLTVNSTTSGLAVRFPTQTITFGSANGLDFLPGETADVFATAYATTFRLIRVPVDTAPTGGQARLSVVNASGTGNYDLHVTQVGGALGTASATGLAPGVVGGPFSVTPGQHDVRLTASGTQTVQIDLGTREFIAANREVFVIAPPAAGATAVRTFFRGAASC